MIIKPSTALRNDYGSISDLAHTEDAPIYITKNGEGDLVIMSIDAYERREEVLKLRAKIEAAEQARLSGQPAYSIEESRKRLEAIYGQDLEAGYFSARPGRTRGNCACPHGPLRPPVRSRNHR